MRKDDETRWEGIAITEVNYQGRDSTAAYITIVKSTCFRILLNEMELYIFRKTRQRMGIDFVNNAWRCIS